MKEILEKYLEEGFVWFYKYDTSILKDKTKATRIFYDEPFFSIEGGMTWVDANSCHGMENYKRKAKFINLDIITLNEPIKIKDYIKIYC